MMRRQRGLVMWALIGALAWASPLGCGDSGEDTGGTSGETSNNNTSTSGGDDAGGDDTGGNNGSGDDAGDDAAVEPDAPVDDDTGGDGPELTYENDILPIFQAYGCVGCHSDASPLGGHSLETRTSLMTTGEHAPVVIACDSRSSVLIQKMLDPPPFGDVMPLANPNRVSPDELATIAAWIDQGAGEPGVECEDDPVGPGTLPEVPPDLVEQRTLRVNARQAMLTETFALPITEAAPSPFFPIARGAAYGYIGARGGIYEIPRDGLVEGLPAGWSAEADLGQVYDVVQPPGESLLAATDVGVLYWADGALWPSPVSDLLAGRVHSLLHETQVDPDGNPQLWLASEAGLYLVADETLYTITPPQEREGGAVGAVTVGPHPSEPLRWALWAAYGPKLYAIATDRDRVTVFPFEVDLGEAILGLGSDTEGVVWALTTTGVWRRRPGALVGKSRWVRWALAADEEPVDLVVHPEGGVWLLTSQGLYHSADGERWTGALDVPVTDVQGLALGDEGSVWLTRPDRAIHAMAEPTAIVLGLEPEQTYNTFPDLAVYPAFADLVDTLTVRVDDCEAVELTEPPFVVFGGGLTWSDCLTEGVHTLQATVTYIHLPDPLERQVSFGWRSRDQVVTWANDIEPIYLTYCAAAGCHATARPVDYDDWSSMTDSIIDRMQRPDGDNLRMPKSGPLMSPETIQTLRWWRDDGFPFE